MAKLFSEWRGSFRAPKIPPHTKFKNFWKTKGFSSFTGLDPKSSECHFFYFFRSEYFFIPIITWVCSWDFTFCLLKTGFRSRLRWGVGCTQFVHGRSRMTIDSLIPTMPGRSMSGFQQQGRHCLHQARSAVRCSASRLWRELHRSKNRS